MLLRQSSNPRVAKKKILSGYTTSAAAVPFSRSRFQVTSMLIERGILDSVPAVQHSSAQSLKSKIYVGIQLVLPQSRIPQSISGN